MTQTPPEPVGGDTVRLREGAVVVDSPADMPDWEFRAFRRTAVLFRDRRYFVSEKRLLGDGSFRYRLEPWGDELTDLPGRTIRYDEHYVAEREAARREAARRQRVAVAFFWVGPLLGFLPSATKLALNDRYGFHPVTVTEQSLLVERLAVYAGIGGIVAVALLDAPASVIAGAVLFLIALLVDLFRRTSSVLEGAIEQPGFLEWLRPSWRGPTKH